MNERAEGYYWVRDAEDGEWEIAYWWRGNWHSWLDDMDGTPMKISEVCEERLSTPDDKER